MEVADDSVCWSIIVARCQYSDIFKIKRLMVDDVYLYVAIDEYSEEKLVLGITELLVIGIDRLISPLVQTA